MKFGEDPMTFARVIERKQKTTTILWWFKGCNSGESGSIWPIIQLDLDVIAFKIFMEFGEELLKIGWVIEWKKKKKKITMIQGP